jgi:anti-sigma factor RsiW
MTFTEADLLAYLDEALPPQQAAEVERAVRESTALQQRLTALMERRDQGGHTLGEIWRRRQLSCISRTDLAQYLQGRLTPVQRDYVEFHTGVIHCPVCEANLEDLRQLSHAPEEDQSQRRRKFFESSAGKLRQP